MFIEHVAKFGGLMVVALSSPTMAQSRTETMFAQAFL